MQGKLLALLVNARTAITGKGKMTAILVNT
jgi:hypothetical protein